MFDHKHYVPRLKGMKGEFEALAFLEPSIRKNITPLIDIPNVRLNETGAPTKPIEKHITEKAKNIRETWGPDNPFFIDFCYLPDTTGAANGEHFITYAHSQMRSMGLHAIPVASFDHEIKSPYNKAIAQVVAKEKRGVCIRLSDEDITFPADLNENLGNLINALSVSPHDVHLIFDFKSLISKNITSIANRTVTILNGLLSIDKWQSITIAGSSFPSTLSKVTEKNFERSELLLYTNIFRQTQKLSRKPTFGDYGIEYPEIQAYGFQQGARPIPNIRYTFDRGWLVLRGVRGDGPIKYQQLSEDLIGRDEYYDADYSWGDKYIKLCASQAVEPSNSTKWRKVGTNHHITLVWNQLSNFF